MFDPAPEAVPIPLVAPVRPLPLERLGAGVEVLLCSGYPSQLTLMVVLRSAGMKLQTADGHLSPPFLFALSLLDAVVVVALVLLFLAAHRESARAVLLGSRPVAREALLGLALLPAVFFLVLAVIALIVRFAPQLHNVPHNPLEDMLGTRRDALIFAVVVMVAGGVREEVQRGFSLHRFDHYLGGAGWGIAVYSVLFGLGHFEQGIDAMIATALLGAIWGTIYLLRGSIVAPMLSHAGFNIAQLLMYFAFVR